MSNMWGFSGNKWLHGAYFMGHGSTKTLGTNNSTLYNNGPTWFVYYRNRDYRDADSSIIAEDTNVTTVENSINYHLGALIIHACESDGDAPRSLVSENGIFCGQGGTYNPILDDTDPIAKNWSREYVVLETPNSDMPIFGYQIGGAQRTKTFMESDE